MGWVGSSHTAWTHGQQLCAPPPPTPPSPSLLFATTCPPCQLWRWTGDTEKCGATTGQCDERFPASFAIQQQGCLAVSGASRGYTHSAHASRVSTDGLGEVWSGAHFTVVSVHPRDSALEERSTGAAAMTRTTNDHWPPLLPPSLQAAAGNLPASE